MRLGCLCAAGTLALALLAPSAVAAAAAAATKTGATSSTPARSAEPEGANGSAFNELSQGGEREATQTQTSERTTSNSSSNTNSKKTVILIVIAAIALLVAIGYVIVRDARKVAPAGDPQVAEARSAHDAAALLRKRRAKAKAARRARRHNR